MIEETMTIDIFCGVYDLRLIKEFFNMKDIERDNIISWLNKITGLNYNLCRSDEGCSASPMMLCLGDVVIMHQGWVK